MPDPRDDDLALPVDQTEPMPPPPGAPLEKSDIALDEAVREVGG